MRYLATVAYDGTKYAGWQVQPNDISIEEEIEKVLSKVLNTPTKIFGSGRTDAGVHATGQTFHFDSKEIADLGKFTYSVNCLLPDDIHVFEIKKVPNYFHARYNVKEKTYSYYINTGAYNVFQKDHVYQLLRKLDLKKIKEGLGYFVGKHYFGNFTTKDEDEGKYIRTIYFADLTQYEDVIKITFVGDGFMRYMVRMMVGILIEIGLGKIEPIEIQRLLMSPHRNVISYKAPATGLYLEKVQY